LTTKIGSDRLLPDATTLMGRPRGVQINEPANCHRHDHRQPQHVADRETEPWGYLSVSGPMIAWPM
jgi:hypothetical protein